MPTITRDDFEKVQINVGSIQEASYIEWAKYSTHYLVIDFGPEIGIKKSCARLTRYEPQELIGRQIIAVMNFPAKQIGKHMSEVLCLGVPDENNDCILVAPDNDAPKGAKLF